MYHLMASHYYSFLFHCGFIKTGVTLIHYLVISQNVTQMDFIVQCLAERLLIYVRSGFLTSIVNQVWALLSKILAPDYTFKPITKYESSCQRFDDAASSSNFWTGSEVQQGHIDHFSILAANLQVELKACKEDRIDILLGTGFHTQDPKSITVVMTNSKLNLFSFQYTMMNSTWVLRQWTLSHLQPAERREGGVFHHDSIH